jgi:hypothetical protein
MDRTEVYENQLPTQQPEVSSRYSHVCMQMPDLSYFLSQWMTRSTKVECNADIGAHFLFSMIGVLERTLELLT